MHTLSHFGSHGPPIQATCIFCAENSVGNGSRHSKIWAWRQRLNHIANHFQDSRFESARPDYLLMDYMYDQKLMSIKEYSHAMNYTERAFCDGLVPLGSKPRASEARKHHEYHDLRKELRQIRMECQIQGRCHDQLQDREDKLPLKDVKKSPHEAQQDATTFRKLLPLTKTGIQVEDMEASTTSIPSLSSHNILRSRKIIFKILQSNRIILKRWSFTFQSREGLIGQSNPTPANNCCYIPGRGRVYPI